MTSTMTIARYAASIVTGGQIKSKRVRESAINALTLTNYQAVIIGAEIVVIVVTVAHTRER
jgi:menaquinone-dependent protoporphyrinogen IX oxidase